MPDSNPYGEHSDMLTVYRLGVVEVYKAEWMKLIHSAMYRSEPAIAIIIYQMMTSHAEPDDNFVRSLRELALYYARPALMAEHTLNQVRLLIGLVEDAVVDGLDRMYQDNKR